MTPIMLKLLAAITKFWS